MKVLLLKVLCFVFLTLTSCKESDNYKQSKIQPIAVVNFESSGCFHWEKSDLTVFKTDDEVYAELKFGTEQHQKAKLDTNKMRIFTEFIEELRKIEGDGFCTTVDTYDVTYKNERIKKTDGHCNWRGFDNLKQSLFRVK